MSDFTKWQWQYTLLVVSFGIGGLWCVLVCVCHLFRTIASTTRKNRAIYRSGSRPNDRLSQRSSEYPCSGSLLHHGVRPVAQPELLSMRPVFFRQLSLPTSTVPLIPLRWSRDITEHYSHSPDVCGVADYRASQAEHVETPVVRRVDEIGRVISSGREGNRQNPSWELPQDLAMNEIPPPYDAVEEHFDFPLLPPSYEHLFPQTEKSS